MKLYLRIVYKSPAGMPNNEGSPGKIMRDSRELRAISEIGLVSRLGRVQ